MNAYLSIPSRYLAGRKLRTFLTTLAVVFGVAVVFSMNMVLPAVTSALNASEMGVTGAVDMTVKSATGEPFQSNLIAQVSQTNGVAAVAPAFGMLITLAPPSQITEFDFVGIDIGAAESVNAFNVTAGRFINGDDSMSAVISQHLAQLAGLTVGDTFKLPTPQGISSLPIVGVYDAQSDDRVLVPLKTAQTLFNAPDKITAIDVAVTAGADRDGVKQAIQQKLGTAFNVGSTASSNAFAQSILLGAIIFNVFGLLTLFMGAFLIFNTFRTVVIERRHDIGMLRAVGATRGTITRLILVESAMQGIIGTLIGLVLGYLLGTLLVNALSGALNQFIRIRVGNTGVPIDGLIISIVLGIGATLLAGLLPALSAGRVPVLAALRLEQAEVVQQRAGKSALVGAGLLVIGIAGLFVGNSAIATLGAVLILIGLVLLVPVLLRPITRFIEPLTRWLFAREGLMAEGNVQRNPGRAAITVSALMIALAVIVALYSVLTSVVQAYNSRLSEQFSADILLIPPSVAVWVGDVGVNDQFEQQLAKIPGVGSWAGLSYAPAQVKGTGVQVLGFDPANYPKVSSLAFDQGNDSTYAELSSGRTTVVSGIFASSMGYKVGDSVPVQTPDGVLNYRIVGIGTDYLGVKLATLYISKQNMTADFHRAEDIMVMANLKPGADAATTRAEIQNLLQNYPQLTLYWGADWREQQIAYLNSIFSALYIVLIALIIPSALGLINTLAINVMERTREIGVLRAVGATRAQIRRLVVAEALLLGLVGTALGLVAGIALGYSLVALVSTTMTSSIQFSFPFVGILFAIVLAIVMALLASVLPARQAARVKIVQALQYE
ncbi:MAG: FtsX-like permease family protein [Chloroflexota bacterium]